MMCLFCLNPMSTAWSRVHMMIHIFFYSSASELLDDKPIPLTKLSDPTRDDAVFSMFLCSLVLQCLFVDEANAR